MKTYWKKIATTLLVGILTWAPHSMASQNLSIQGALQLAKQQNLALSSAKEIVQRAETEKISARANFMPQISMDLTYTRIDEPIDFDLNAIRSVILGMHPQVPTEMIPDFSLRVQEDHFIKGSLTAVWPIFAGGRIWAGYKAADAKVNASNLEWEGKSQELYQQVFTAYFDLKLAREFSELQDSLASNIAEHMKKAELLFQQGQIANTQLLSAKVALLDAQRDAKKAHHNQELVHLLLQDHLNTNDDIMLSSSLFEINNVPEFAVLEQQLLSTQPLLLRIDAELQRSNYGKKAARGNFMPTIALFGKKEIITDDLTLLEPEWAVGVKLSYPIFQGGKNVATYKKYDSYQKELLIQKEDAKNKLVLLLNKQYKELENYLRESEDLKTLEQLVDDNVKAQQLAFENGMATSNDVVDAELKFSAVKMAQKKVLHDADIALAMIYKQCGNVLQIFNHMEIQP